MLSKVIDFLSAKLSFPCIFCCLRLLSGIRKPDFTGMVTVQYLHSYHKSYKKGCLTSCQTPLSSLYVSSISDIDWKIKHFLRKNFAKNIRKIFLQIDCFVFQCYPPYFSSCPHLIHWISWKKSTFSTKLSTKNTHSHQLSTKHSTLIRFRNHGSWTVICFLSVCQTVFHSSDGLFPILFSPFCLSKKEKAVWLNVVFPALVPFWLPEPLCNNDWLGSGILLYQM